MEKLIITPKTKIYDLLQAYPQLEQILLDATPQFSKLKNPILRNTIARFTNISQAAAIANLNVEELVNKLRAEVGQLPGVNMETQTFQYTTAKPEWFTEKSITKTIDIRDMLHAGEQPVHEVLDAIKKLGQGKIVQVIAPFIPAPLLDKSLSLNHKHWLRQIAPEEYRVYFTKE